MESPTKLENSNFFFEGSKKKLEFFIFVGDPPFPLSPKVGNFPLLFFFYMTRRVNYFVNFSADWGHETYNIKKITTLKKKIFIMLGLGPQ